MVKDDTCDVDAVTGLINKYVPDAKLESNISAELSYILPRESASKFEVVIKTLWSTIFLLDLAKFDLLLNKCCLCKSTSWVFD